MPGFLRRAVTGLCAVALALSIGAGHGAPAEAAPAPVPTATAAGDYAPSAAPAPRRASAAVTTESAAAIQAKYESLGAAAANLGAPNPQGISCTTDELGCVEGYAHGAIMWRSGGGAFVIWGAIFETWLPQYDTNFLGYPKGDEHCDMAGGGCYQVFDRATVVWHPGGGPASFMYIGYWGQWNSVGAERGMLGWPTASTVCTTVDRCYTPFQGGSIHWTRAWGGFVTWGAIGSAFRRSVSALGYPTSAEDCTPAGCRQVFERGIITWSPAAGARVMAGAIGAYLLAHPNVVDRLGYATTGENCGLPNGGCWQGFEQGLMYWSPASGTSPIWGGMLATYRALGYERSKLGYPTSAEACGLRDGGCWQGFQGGLMYWTAKTGAQPVLGGIRDTYAQLGWENSWLGYPTSGEVCTSDGCSQQFEGGRIVWTPSTGAHAVK